MTTSVTTTASDPAVPPFRLDRPRYDQATFTGRLRHFVNVLDPRTLFTTSLQVSLSLSLLLGSLSLFVMATHCHCYVASQLRDALDLLDNYKRGTLPAGVTDQQLWAAKKTRDAIIHPDTGEEIFLPFRMAGYVPFGVPVAMGMVLPHKTLAATIFWLWLNQTHNALVNYSNRNASVPTPPSTYVAGYLGAVTTGMVWTSLFLTSPGVSSSSSFSLRLPLGIRSRLWQGGFESW